MAKKTKAAAKTNTLMSAVGRLMEQALGRDIEPAAKKAPAHRRRPVVETLEQRLLLSATPLPQPSFNTTLSYSALPTGALDATLEVVDTGAPHLTLQLRRGDQVLASETLDENLRVAFTGSAFNDTLTIKLDGNTSPYAIKIDFDGGTDVPGASDDQLILDGTDAKGLFVNSSDDVLIQGALQIDGDLDVQSKERIDVAQGASLAAQDIRLAALDEAKAGVLGTEIRAVADAQVNLLGATLTGRNISIDAEAKVTLDSKDTELFGKQLKLGVVDAKAAAAIALSGANQITATGTLAMEASAKVDTKLASAPDDSSKNTAKDAAVAITHIDSSAQVRVGGSSGLSAGGALSLAANNAVTAKTTADGSAGTAAGDAKGAVLAASYIHGDTKAELADSASLSGSAIAISANATRSAEVLAKATKGGAEKSADGANESEKKLAEEEAKTSDGSLQFAAAVAVGAINGQSQVLLGGSGALTATEAITVNAGMALSGQAGGLSTTADGSNKEASGTGVGVAVAINTAKAGSQVLLSGSSTLSATGGVNVTSTASSAQFGAQATSGASPTGLGVAGSLAINAGVLKAEALIAAGASITVAEGTTLTLKAETRSSDSAKANAKTTAGGEHEGAGASVAINVADTVARAAVEAGGKVNGAGSLKLDAQSSNTVVTEAKGGAEGGTAITPVAAITLAHHDTVAELRGDEALALKDVALNAKHEGQADTTAEGTPTGTKSALGMAFATAFVVDNTRAAMDRALVLGGALDLAASGKQTTNTTAKSSVKGGKAADKAAEGDVDKEKAAQRAAVDDIAADKGARGSADAGATPKAETPTGNGDTEGSDSSALSTAGALAVNVASSRVDAGITVGREVTAAGAVTIKAQAEAHSAAVADGTVTLVGENSNDKGVGVAIALNVGSAEAHAYVAGKLNSAGLSLTAGTPDDAKHTSKAVATAGAGGGKLGAAGALAINAGSAKTLATVDHAARLTLTGEGALSLKAQSSSEQLAEAKPKEVSGKKTGIGAAVSFNLADESTTARINGGAEVAGAASVTLSADSKN
ncbi:MAG: LEPR-XLL domain-containing protein, partial [Burkholderiaceae bacterium]|nr:LEPR-XLL domain-containing protein [Burkholderiaceae bacterium]